MMSKGWRIARFDEILTKIDRKFIIDDDQEYNCVGVRWYGNGTFIREKQLGAEISRKQQWIITSGDVVYNKLFAWKNAFAVADETVDGCIVSDKFPTYQIKPDLIDPKYLAFYFTTPQIGAQAQSLSKGAAAISKLTLNPPQFWDLTIPLPPLDEQRRIVERVEVHAARIAKAQSLREEISEETELLLAAELKKLRYELLGSKFTKNKLGDITQVTAGGTPSRDNPSYWKGKIPWIKTGELLDGDIYSSGEHITEEGMKNSSAKLFPKETILIALYGQGQTRGRTGRLMIEATTNQACCAILPTPDLLEPRFTQYWLRSLYYEMREQNHGGAQPNWNGAMIKNIEISIPPLDEQRRIVAYLDSVQARLASLRELQSQSGEELDALLPSILDKAFKGEL